MPWPSPRTRHQCASGTGSTGRPVRVVLALPWVLDCHLWPSLRVVLAVRERRCRRPCHPCPSLQVVQVVPLGQAFLAVPSLRVVPCHRLDHRRPSRPSGRAFRPDQLVRVVPLDPVVRLDRACPILRLGLLGLLLLVDRQVQVVQVVPSDPVGKHGTFRHDRSALALRYQGDLDNLASHRRHSRRQHRHHPVDLVVLVGTCSCRYTGTGRQPDAQHVGDGRAYGARGRPPSRRPRRGL